MASWWRRDFGGCATVSGSGTQLRRNLGDAARRHRNLGYLGLKKCAKRRRAVLGLLDGRQREKLRFGPDAQEKGSCAP